jgi:hypothetical protein
MAAMAAAKTAFARRVRNVLSKEGSATTPQFLFAL